MNLDELKKEIDWQMSTVKDAGDIKSYFVILGYEYPNFSVHMDVSSLQLASMLFRTSSNCGILRKAILATAALIKAKQEGVE